MISADVSFVVSFVVLFVVSSVVIAIVCFVVNVSFAVTIWVGYLWSASACNGLKDGFRFMNNSQLARETMRLVGAIVLFVVLFVVIAIVLFILICGFI